MTELKTLKDIRKWHEDVEPFDRDTRGDEIIDKMKKEAIKWIKEFQSNNSILYTHKNGFSFPLTNYQPIIDWIKHFFNITSEDLKCKELDKNKSVIEC